jgi:hypothetical protein
MSHERSGWVRTNATAEEIKTLVGALTSSHGQVRVAQHEPQG